MAAETLTCKVCLQLYDEQERRPKLVTCGIHTTCLHCLKHFQTTEGRIKCAECNDIYWETPEELKDNLTIISMLEDLNLRCVKHETRATSFCSGHFKPLCDACTDHTHCKLLDIVESHQEINFSAIEKILELQKKVEALSIRVPLTMAPRIRDCRREILKTNFSTYLGLLKLLPQVSCDNCKAKENLLLERRSLVSFCNKCLTPGSDPANFISLDDENAAIPQVLKIVKDILVEVNVEELTPDSLRGLKARQTLSIFEILTIIKPLRKDVKRVKTSYENLPSEFLCLDCGSLLRKSNSQVREMKCRGMHVVCEDCCSRMSSVQTICPLDGNMFAIPPANLTQHSAPQHQAVDPAYYPQGQYPQYQSDEYQYFQNQPEQYSTEQYQQYLQYQLHQAQAQGPRYSPAAFPQQMQYGFPQQMPYGLPQQMPYGLPQQLPYGLPQQAPVAPFQQVPAVPVYQPEIPPARPAEVPRNPPPHTQIKRDTEHPNTVMPPFQPPASQSFLDRFVSVMPEVGLPESRMTADTKGWTIHCRKNQVEAMTVQCFADVQLLGIAVANPVTPGVVAKLKFIKFYSSRSVRGRPLYEQTPNADLVGGNSVLTFVQLSPPVRIPAFTMMAMKVQIAAPAGHGDTLMVYRGNPFDRPETWSGSDEVTWEFEEVKDTDLENGEYSNGQNNYSGPILRFLYTT